MKIETKITDSSKLPIHGAPIFAFVIGKYGGVWRKGEFDQQNQQFVTDMGFASYSLKERLSPEEVGEWHYYSDEPPL